jgi:hypothetical protein
LCRLDHGIGPEFWTTIHFEKFITVDHLEVEKLEKKIDVEVPDYATININNVLPR